MPVVDTDKSRHKAVIDVQLGDVSIRETRASQEIFFPSYNPIGKKDSSYLSAGSSIYTYPIISSCSATYYAQYVRATSSLPSADPLGKAPRRLIVIDGQPIGIELMAADILCRISVQSLGKSLIVFNLSVHFKMG